MRRFFAAIAITLAVLPFAARAEDLWKMDAFRSEIAVRADGVVEVKETIGADFTTARHGLYRYVPYQGKNESGGRYRVDITLLSITRDGASEPYEETKDGKDVRWKIGDANRTLTGTHTYVITYDVTGALGEFDTYDEVYWNATGDGWDVPLPAGTAAVVRLPQGVDVSQSACYTGPAGSTAKDCSVIPSPYQVSFATKSEGEPLTVAVGFAIGRVPVLKPSASNSAQDLLRLVVLPLLLPVAAFLWLYFYWRRKGVDQKFGAIVAQYEAPDGMRPSEIRALLAQASSATIEVAPTIVDLAVRGYLRIEETSLGFFNLKDYVIHLLKDFVDDPAIKPFERILLQGMFISGVETVGYATEVRVSTLRAQNYSKHVSAAAKALAQGLVTDGYLDADADKAKTRLLIAGIAIAAGAIVFHSLLNIVGPGWIYSLLFVGLMTSFFARYMAKWTPKGHEAAWRAKGYKEFISKVEKYRAPWMETQDIFEKTLPYALAFGLGSRWAKAFASMQLSPPSWYQSAHAGVWSPVAFHQSMQGLSHSMSTASGTSGSGGGGHSGGGGGGGGGGSW